MQALSDKPPYPGMSDFKLIKNIFEEVPYPRSLHPAILEDATVWREISRCMCRKAEDRPDIFAIADALRQELEFCVERGRLRTAGPA